MVVYHKLLYETSSITLGGVLRHSAPLCFLSLPVKFYSYPVSKRCYMPVSLTTLRLIPNFLSMRATQMMVNRTTEVYRLTSSFDSFILTISLTSTSFNTHLMNPACQDIVVLM